MEYTLERRVKDFWNFLNCHVKAYNLMRKSFKSLGKMQNLQLSREIHLVDFFPKLKEFNIAYKREDWDGNKCCNSNWDIVYIEYRGCKFWELIEKDEK